MKAKGPSNVFTLPNWMKNLRAKEPEGAYTPDQVASSLELCILFNNGDVTVLKEAIASLVPRVPLKRQATLKALSQGDVLANVQAFIAEVNILLAPLLKEEIPHVTQESPLSGGSSNDVGSADDGDWEDDSDLRRKPSTRGIRALRNAKRQSVESAS